MEWIFLVLAVLVVVFGLGVLLVSRRRTSTPPPPSRPTRPTPRPPRDTAPPDRTPAGDTLVDEPVAEQAPTADEAPEAPADEPAADDAGDADGAGDVALLERPTLRARMAKARSSLVAAFGSVRGRTGITADTWDDLEEALLRADVGVHISDDLLTGLRARVETKEITEPAALLEALRDEMASRLAGADRQLHFDDAPGGPNVWLFVGVNGVGKTTTIGKVAHQQREDGRSVLLAAGDTFRAAAAEQLETWAERADAAIVRGAEGSDPSSVIYDAIERANSRGVDLVLGDTAGRLHTKKNLMDELAKVRRVAAKGAGRVTEVLLVIDATTGQNGLTQAREFGDATTASDGNSSGITGVVLTKLDGSAKGGVVFAIETELGVPIKLVGVGEGLVDLIEFDPGEFVDALFED